jgi:hypothetical protein
LTCATSEPLSNQLNLAYSGTGNPNTTPPSVPTIMSTIFPKPSIIWRCFRRPLTAFRSRILRSLRAPRPEGSGPPASRREIHPLDPVVQGARNLGLGPAGLTFCASEELQVHSKRSLLCGVRVGTTGCCHHLATRGCMQRPRGTRLERCHWGYYSGTSWHLSSEARPRFSNPTRFYRQIQERMTDSLYF